MGKMKVLLLLCCCASYVMTMPTNTDSLVVSSTEPSKEGGSDDNKASQAHSSPQIYEMDVNANVSNRFGKTLITSKVRNPDTKAQEITFSVILPEKAFISEFVMEIGGKSYKAYVKEKEEAKQIYNDAVASGTSAAHVAVSARDSNRFTVSVNVEAEGKAIFYLTYEELLERKNDMYEIVINIHPGQIVKHLGIKVNINESNKLTFVRTPSLRSGKEVSKNDIGLEPNTNIQLINDTSAVVTFNPDIEQQRQFAEKLGSEKENGLSGQFVVQYDVDRDSQGGEVLIKDGYFVHFFAPKDIKPLPKHVVFVLDNSGSMAGDKLDKLKKAMESILSELREVDVFNIVDFSSSVRIWDIENSEYKDFGETPIPELDKLPKESTVLEAVEVNPEKIGKAKKLAEQLTDIGATNIIGGLEAGIYLVRNAKNIDKSKYQPLIIFLTDGEPNVRLYDGDSIINEVDKLNNEDKIPIFSLSFGEDADKDFLRKLSLKNLGFSRHIYVAADADLQLQDFYKQISSPLLNNVTFEYVDKDVQQVTKTDFPIFFDGTEIVIAGRYIPDTIDPGFAPNVWCNSFDGRLQLKPVQENSVTDLERLWAYLTIKQVLEKKDATDDKDDREALKKQALDLALKYSFVTPVSSLVVVKPNDTSSVNTEDASVPRLEGDYNMNYNHLRLGSGAPVSLSISGKRGQAAIVPAFGFGGVSYEAESLDEEMDSFPFGPMLSTTPLLVSTTDIPVRRNVTSIDELKARLPWLANILDANQKFELKGNSYKLGFGESVTSHPECTNAPAGDKGECKLLHECFQAHKYLDDFAKYETFFCPLDEFAGVCCPTSESVI